MGKMKIKQWMMGKTREVPWYFLEQSLLNMVKERNYDPNDYENLCMLQRCVLSHPLSHEILQLRKSLAWHIFDVSKSLEESLQTDMIIQSLRSAVDNCVWLFCSALKHFFSHVIQSRVSYHTLDLLHRAENGRTELRSVQSI